MAQTTTTPKTSYDVIIVGAGPVGLFLATELAKAEVSVLVLEREKATGGPWKDGPLGMRGLHIPSIEAMYRRGLLNKIMTTLPLNMIQPSSNFTFGGHFAGMLLNRNKVDFSRWKYYLPGPAPAGAASSLGRLEAAFAEHAESLGVNILRGDEVLELHDDGERVRVVTGEHEFTAQWLVGCDGGRSAIRKMAGFDFVGTDAEFTMYLADCDLDKPELIKQGIHRTDTGLYMSAHVGQVYVMDHDLTFDHRTQTLTPEHFQNVLQRVSGLDVKVLALKTASVTVARARQVTEYRRGRVLLAGDSAHIHSPLGAQGLNTGIADAMNLGWKLAATVKGTAAPGLIDTYHNERHPIAANVLEWTRAQAATLRLDPASKALAKVVNALLETDQGTSFFIERIWSLNARYDLGDAHDLVGRSAPDLEYEDGSRLGDKLHNARFVLVDCEGDASLEKLVQTLRSDVEYFTARPKNALDIKAMLLRPDGVVAWAAEDAIDVSALKAALSRYLVSPHADDK